MDRCALFVDAGYVLADGAMAVHGTRRRESVTWDYAGLLQLLSTLATERSGLPLLRCYWYEGAADGRRSADHDALADMPGVKLRLVRNRPGGQGGVEAEMHRDLTALARNQAVSDAMIVSSTEELTQVVADIQNLGMRVTLLHIAADGGWTISRTLRQECDDIVEISTEHLRPYVELISGAEPPRADESGTLSPAHPRSNGHAPGGQTTGYAPMLPASVPAGGNGHNGHGYQVPLSMYPAPAVAEYQQPARPLSQPASPAPGSPVPGSSAPGRAEPGAQQPESPAARQLPAAAQPEFAAPSSASSGPSSAPSVPPTPPSPAPASAPQDSPAVAGDLFAGLAAMPVKRPDRPEGQPDAAGPSRDAAGPSRDAADPSRDATGPRRDSAPRQFVESNQPAPPSSREQRRSRGEHRPSRAQQFASRIEQLSTPLQPQADQASPSARQGLPRADQPSARQDPSAGSPSAGLLPAAPGHASSGHPVPGHAAPAPTAAPVQPEFPGGQEFPPANGSMRMAQPDAVDTADLTDRGEMLTRVEQSGPPMEVAQPSHPAQPGHPAQPDFGASQDFYAAPVAEAALPPAPQPTPQSAPPGRHSGDFPMAGTQAADASGYSFGGTREAQAEAEQPDSGSAQIHQLPTRGPDYPASGGNAGVLPTSQGTGAHAAVPPGPRQVDTNQQLGSVTPLAPSYTPAGSGPYSGQNGQNGQQPVVSQPGQPDPRPYADDALAAGAHQAPAPGIAQANGSARYPVTGQHVTDLYAPDASASAPPAPGQAAPTQAGFGQHGHEQPGYGEQPAYEQQPAYGQPDHGQPDYSRPEHAQAEYGQPDYGQADPLAGAGTGAAPENPGNPANPGVPISPGAPVSPGTPVNPGTPINPGTPVNPGALGLVGSPVNGASVNPGAPVNSDGPGNPPVGPSAPGMPANPGNPVSPGQGPRLAATNPSSLSLADAVQSAHDEGQEFGGSVARDAPALWLEAVLARKPRMPSDLEARLLQGSSLPIDFLLHDEVRHALRRGFWDALERARR